MQRLFDAQKKALVEAAKMGNVIQQQRFIKKGFTNVVRPNIAGNYYLHDFIHMAIIYMYNILVGNKNNHHVIINLTDITFCLFVWVFFFSYCDTSIIPLKW